MKLGADDPGACLESELVFDAGLFLNKPGKAAGAVSAHIAGAAVAVVEFPGPIGFAALARH